jgi:hypothetical protein
MTMQTIPTAAPWYTHRWPWLLMLGPLLAIVAGSFSAYLAISRPDALVAGDYYKKGKAINQDLRRERAALVLGMGLELGFEAGEGRLKGRVSGQAGSGPLVLRLVHATQPEKDLVLRVTPLADGTFALPLPALERTRWHVLMENQGGTWSLGGAWNWPAERSVRIGASRL